MKRFHHYLRDHPLPTWLLTSAVFLAFNALVFWSIPVRKNPALFLLGCCFALASPTMALVRRFSDEQRRENPILPQQEKGVGIVSLLLAVCSIGALAGVILSPRHLHLPSQAGMWLLAVYSGSALLSVVLGSAARHTKLGRWGLYLSLGWITVLISFASMALLRSA